MMLQTKVTDVKNQEVLPYMGMTAILVFPS